MLEKHERERLLDRLGLPEQGRRLILDAARNAPVRNVESKGGNNVITVFQSLKMQRPIGTESRHLEFPLAVSKEHDPAVLEYFAQPCRLSFEFIDANGEIHQVTHTPDCLEVTERSVYLEEFKEEVKLEGLARRAPWKYQRDPDNRWRSPPLEAWLAERGIGYRIITDKDIPRRRIENILLLEDYLDPTAPQCPLDVELCVRNALAEEATLYLAELYEKAQFTPDDAFKLIADGKLVAEIDHAALNEPTRCRVFRDTAVRDFELARIRTRSDAVAGSIDLAVGARLTYDQHPYTVVMVGGTHAILESDDRKTVEVSLNTLEGLALKQDLAMADESGKAADPVRLSDFSPAELESALRRMQALENVTKPNRTQRRHLGAIAIAKLTGTDELVALVPRLRERGNRTPRLSEEQEAALNYVIGEEYLKSSAPNAKHCHGVLRTVCALQGIRAPSYPTLIERIKAVSQKKADRARHGSRTANQNADFVDVLHVDTPVHGSRAFQYVHMDHTELDIELLSASNGKNLGRAWLSIAIDAYTRRILGLYLSFDPPSYRSNMMLIRDIVRRYRRLPQFVIVDNGPDFRSAEFKQFCELMRIHPRYRPRGKPRWGAVMERIFGTAHTQYVHNLAGNTKAMKDVRQTTGKFLPSRLAEWTLEAMYYGLEYWAFTYYDNKDHPALGISPRQAFARSMASSGLREHRIVTLTKDFLVLSCPTVGRNGRRKVDRQRGIKVHNNYFYWCPEFRNPKVVGTAIPVRYDPWDSSTVYVQVDKKWVAARCKALSSLGQITEKERELVSGELYKQSRVGPDDELSTQRLVEFMRVFTPAGAMELALERQSENRALYAQVGIGAVTPAPEPELTRPRIAASSTASPAIDSPPAPATDPESTEWPDSEAPDFDTF